MPTWSSSARAALDNAALRARQFSLLRESARSSVRLPRALERALAGEGLIAADFEQLAKLFATHRVEAPSRHELRTLADGRIELRVVDAAGQRVTFERARSGTWSRLAQGEASAPR